MKPTDKVILQKQEEIRLLKLKIQKSEKFIPVTNCRVKIWGESYNLHVCTVDDLKHIIAVLKSLNSDYSYNDYMISDWIRDAQSRLEYLTCKNERDRLSGLQNKLFDLLTNDTKVGLELEKLIKEI